MATTDAPWTHRAQRDRRHFGLAVGVTVAFLAVVVLTALAFVVRSSPQPLGWGRAAATEARALGAGCPSPVAMTAASGAMSVVQCNVTSGSYAVSSYDNAQDQQVAVSAIIAQAPNACLIVGPGYTIVGPEAVITTLTGDDIAAFLAQYNGAAVGAC